MRGTLRHGEQLLCFEGFFSELNLFSEGIPHQGDHHVLREAVA